MTNLMKDYEVSLRENKTLKIPYDAPLNVKADKFRQWLTVETPQNPLDESTTLFKRLQRYYSFEPSEIKNWRELDKKEAKEIGKSVQISAVRNKTVSRAFYFELIDYNHDDETGDAVETTHGEPRILILQKNKPTFYGSKNRMTANYTVGDYTMPVEVWDYPEYVDTDTSAWAEINAEVQEALKAIIDAQEDQTELIPELYDNKFGLYNDIRIRYADHFKKGRRPFFMNEKHLANPFVKLLLDTIEAIIDKHLQDAEDVILMDKYNLENLSSSARAFETKLTNNKEHLAAAKASKFNNLFKFVEMDDAVKLDKLPVDEANFAYLMPMLPTPKDPELRANFRIRLLGRHKATGVYFVSWSKIDNSIMLNDVTVDVRDTSSFLHEYGHSLDYTYKALGTEYGGSKKWIYTGSLSMDDEFKAIKRYYQEHLEPTSKDDYYKTPTEIFARAFEVWFAHNNVWSGLQHDKVRIHNKEYKPLWDMVDDINDYFLGIFGNVFDVQQEPEEVIVEVAASKSSSSVATVTPTKYQIEITYDEFGQGCLF
jgi:hypothetical protein